MHNKLKKVGGFVKKAVSFCAEKTRGGIAALGASAATIYFTVTDAFAQSATGNSGADAVIDGVDALTPIVTSIIAACIALGFIVLAAVIGWKVFKKFWG